MEDAYATLPPVRRQVFIMSRLEGKTNTEIAKILHPSNSNIENHLNKALKAIKNKFNSSDNFLSRSIQAGSKLSLLLTFN